MQLMVELIGVELKLRSTETNCVVLIEISTDESVPTLHTTCECCLWLPQFQLGRARRFWCVWCSSPITSLSCTCGGQGCIIHFHTIIDALRAEEKDEQCVVRACIHAYVHACVCAHVHVPTQTTPHTHSLSYFSFPVDVL